MVGYIPGSIFCVLILGVQDTKSTSPAPSTSRTISNKDSKESFMSTELAEILEDDESDSVKPTLTEDMFDSPEEYKQALRDLHEDILREMGQELYSESFEDVDVEDETDNEEVGEIESEEIETKYEKSIVNGLTVTVESLDKTDKRMTRSLSRKRFNFAFPGHTCDGNNVLTNIENMKASTSTIETTANAAVMQPQILSSIECEPENEFEYSSCKTERPGTRNYPIKVKPAIPPKPVRDLNTRNKLGLRIHSERTVSELPNVNETERSFDSGFRSFDSGNFDNNKKANRSNHKGPTVKRTTNTLHYNDDSIIVEEEPSIIVEEEISSTKSDVTINEENLHPHQGFPPLISVQAPSTETISTDGSSFWFNKSDLTKDDDNFDKTSGNQVTCMAEVHREKTLSPTGSASDVLSPRRRKISVVSKDEKETFV